MIEGEDEERRGVLCRVSQDCVPLRDAVTYDKLVGIRRLPKRRVALGPTLGIVAESAAMLATDLQILAAQQARGRQRSSSDGLLLGRLATVLSRALGHLRHRPVAACDPVDGRLSRCGLAAAAPNGMEFLAAEIKRLEGRCLGLEHRCWEFESFLGYGDWAGER